MRVNATGIVEMESIDVQENVTANIVYVNAANASDTLPGHGTGTITLAADTEYRSDKGLITITDDIDMVANSKMCAFNLSTDSTIIGEFELSDCDVLYTGTATLFAEQALVGVSDLDNIKVTCSSTGTIFGVVGDGGGGSAIICLSSTFIQGDLGSIEACITVFTICQIIYFEQGLTITDGVVTSFKDVQMFGTDEVTTFITFDGTHGAIHIGSVAPTLQANEYFLDFTSGGTFSTVTAIGNVVGGATDNVFAPSSYNQTDVGFKFSGNTFIQDSQSIGSVVCSGNAVETDIALQGAFYPLNLDGSAVLGSNAERWTLANPTTAGLTYAGNEPFSGSMHANITSISSGSAQEFEFKVQKNGNNMADGVLSGRQMGSDYGNLGLIVPITAVTGDGFEIKVQNLDGTSNVTIKHLSIEIK
jgi:hypothetical protein